MRVYRTQPTMLHEPFTEKVIMPDSNLVKSLHRLLDMVPDDQLAAAIDYHIAEIISFRNPNRQHYPEVLPAETEVK